MPRHRALFLLGCHLLCLASTCRAWSGALPAGNSGLFQTTMRNQASWTGARSASSPTNQLQPPIRRTVPHPHGYCSMSKPMVRSTVTLQLGILDVEDSNYLVPALLTVAIGLFVAAQGWINQLLSGDRGLGAFLSDGSGFKKSGFRPVDKKTDTAGTSDPLPWLKLPKLDFVQVAGQERDSEEVVLERLESLRLEMNSLLEKNKFSEAGTIKQRLEQLMRENGVAYQYDEVLEDGDRRK